MAARERKPDIAPRDVSPLILAVAAPPQLHPFLPAGQPIGAALGVSPPLRPLTFVLDALGRVHGDGDLAPLAVEAMMGRLRGDKFEAGNYTPGTSPRLEVH